MVHFHAQIDLVVLVWPIWMVDDVRLVHLFPIALGTQARAFPNPKSDSEHFIWLVFFLLLFFVRAEALYLIFFSYC